LLATGLLNAPQCPIEHYFWKVPRLHPTDTICTTESIVGMILTGGKPKVLGEKPVPVTLPTELSHGLTWDRTQVSAVGRRLST